MKSLLKKIAGLATIATALNFFPVNKNGADETFLYAGLSANCGIGATAATIENVPEIARNIFGYSYDGYFVMDNKPVRFNPVYGTLELKTGVGIRNFLIDFEIGPKIDLVFMGNGFSGIKQKFDIYYPCVHEQLSTYYNFGEGIIDKNPSVPSTILGVSAKVSLLKSIYLEADADFGNELYIEKGIDGGWFLLAQDKLKLADLINYSVKLGFDYPIDYKIGTKMGFFVGVNFPQILNETSLGRDADLKVSPNFFIGIKAEYFDFQFPIGEN